MRRLRSDERGMTLSELLISVSILLIVSGAFLVVVETVQRAVAKQQDHNLANDQARLAVEQLDREIRSSNVLYDPAGESPAYYSLRVYTQSNANTRLESKCVQWRIDDRELQRRDWSPSAPSTVSSWRVIATNVVNVDLAERAFEISYTTPQAGRTLDVSLVLDGDPGDATISPIRVQTSLTGRNSGLGFPSAVCTPAPS